MLPHLRIVSASAIVVAVACVVSAAALVVIAVKVLNGPH